MNEIERGRLYQDLLHRHVVTAWFPRSIDREYGGFLCDFDRRWRPCGPQEKLLEFQARHALTAAELSMAFPDNSDLAEAVEAGFAFLRDVLWDREYGGWHAGADRSGVPTDPTLKHTHGMAYAIQACFAVHAATGDAEALALGNLGLEWIDANAHDRDHGGYFGPLFRDGKRITPHSGIGAVDLIGSPVGVKDMNVNGDIYEMFTAAAGMEGTPRFCAERLDEMRDIVVRHYAAPGRHPWQYFSDDWEGQPPSWYPGIATQIACRLLEDADPAGKHERQKAARRLFDWAWRHGRSPGGDLNFRRRAGSAEPVRDWADIQWWAQFELLRAAEYLAHLDPDDAEAAGIAAFARRLITSDVLDRDGQGSHMHPRAGSEWYDRLFRTDRWHRATRKAAPWKDASHDGRILLRLAKLTAAETKEDVGAGGGRLTPASPVPALS